MLEKASCYLRITKKSCHLLRNCLLLYIDLDLLFEEPCPPKAAEDQLEPIYHFRWFSRPALPDRSSQMPPHRTGATHTTPLILPSPCLRSPVLHLTQYWHHELHSLHRSRVGPRKCLAMGPEQLISLADWHVSWQIKVRTTIDTWLSLGNKKDLAIKCYASKSKSHVTIAALWCNPWGLSMVQQGQFGFATFPSTRHDARVSWKLP